MRIQYKYKDKNRGTIDWMHFESESDVDERILGLFVDCVQFETFTLQMRGMKVSVIEDDKERDGG